MSTSPVDQQLVEPVSPVKKPAIDPSVAVEKRIFVGGLTPSIPVSDIESRLKSFGQILKPVELVNKNDVQIFAYTTINITGAQWGKLRQYLNGSKYKGATLRIEEAKPSWKDIREKEVERERVNPTAVFPHPRKKRKYDSEVEYGREVDKIDVVMTDGAVKKESTKWVRGRYGRAIALMHVFDQKKNQRKLVFDPKKQRDFLVKLWGNPTTGDITWQYDEERDCWVDSHGRERAELPLEAAPRDITQARTIGERAGHVEEAPAPIPAPAWDAEPEQLPDRVLAKLAEEALKKVDRPSWIDEDSDDEPLYHKERGFELVNTHDPNLVEHLDEDEAAAAARIAAEKSKNLDILKGLIGAEQVEEVQERKERERARVVEKSWSGTARFDPTAEDAEQYEAHSEEEKEVPELRIEEMEDEEEGDAVARLTGSAMPKVSQEIDSTVNVGNLKTMFTPGETDTGFSLFGGADLGSDIDEDGEEEEEETYDEPAAEPVHTSVDTSNYRVANTVPLSNKRGWLPSNPHNQNYLFFPHYGTNLASRSVFHDDGKVFWRTKSEEEIREAWRAKKIELTRDWKSKRRDALRRKKKIEARRRMGVAK
ncbi:hypothetical protein YB2330_003255 [Saitoella coloradoensis]